MKSILADLRGEWTVSYRRGLGKLDQHFIVMPHGREGIDVEKGKRKIKVSPLRESFAISPQTCAWYLFLKKVIHKKIPFHMQLPPELRCSCAAYKS